MSKMFGKFKGGSSTTTTSSGASPTKKDPNAPQPTPLERMLLNAGPIRNDGSDKFFGMENFGNTCYCNSVLQCLYYSVPFRDQVLSYPQRSTEQSLKTAASSATPRPPFNAQKSSLRPGNQPNQQQKPEDKDSPEYKKKQALVAGPILNMSYQNAGGYDMPETLYSSLKDIFEAIVVNQARNGVISPSKFIETLRKENEMFRTSMHQDAHEFLNLLLNTMMENIEANEKKLATEKDQKSTNSGTEDEALRKAESATVSFPSFLPTNNGTNATKWLQELFEGTLTSETRCLTCENVSQRDEPFLDLSVDLEQHSSVTSCLRRFSAEEMLCERNKFHCDNCGGLQEAEKRMKIKRLPKILALHLKRFKYTEDLQRLQKLFHKVVYPYHLRLFNTTDDAEDADRLYELYAVVVHIGGGPYHGHYVAIIKTQDRGWLLFDDEMVEPVDEGYVRNFFGNKDGMACAYVLFYQETTIEKVRQEQRSKGKRRASQEFLSTAVRAKESAEIHRVQSASPPASPGMEERFVSLDHAMTAPPTANGHIEPPKSPPIVSKAQPTPATPGSPVPKNKKEQKQAEKDRKAAEKLAEKERDKAEKQRRKEMDIKLRDATIKQQHDLRAALEASKVSKAEEDRFRVPEAGKENGTNGSPSSAANGIFKRSKSIRFGSLGRKPTNASTTTSSEEALDNADTADREKDKDKEKEKEKRNRFSIRKKSFGLLNSP